jgi:O-acetyl-ADP-ribose deacetylase (regulator of RNase III)
VCEPEVIVADLTEQALDAIVNAANDMLAPGGGVCGAIHAGAGPKLAAACAELGGCPTGDARITPGFLLPARYVIHAVGPFYEGGHAGEADALRACYERSLELAQSHGLESIGFPCVSTGIYGYPADEAARIALTTIIEWLIGGRHPQRVVCCCFSEADAGVYRQTLASLRS